MNSTDTNSGSRNERQLRVFFREQLVPAAKRCNYSTALPLQADPSIASYYRRRNEESQYVFELDTTNAAAHLTELWRDEPELVSLIGPLLTLGESLAERSEPSAEISPFVYAMF